MSLFNPECYETDYWIFRSFLLPENEHYHSKQTSLTHVNEPLLNFLKIKTDN